MMHLGDDFSLMAPPLARPTIIKKSTTPQVSMDEQLEYTRQQEDEEHELCTGELVGS